ncbi:MAG: hypothetical protein JWL79_2565 [Frankiales bacterium]|nr:hypothetical protein [Frankiales bacterium]
MTRIEMSGAALLTLALLTSGCGTTKDTPPTKAQGTAAAKAINLVKADLGAGYTSTPSDPSGKSGAIPADVATCLGLSGSAAADSTSLVDISSDDFAKGAPPNGVQLSSEVEVVASTKDAHKQLTAFQSDKASTCLGTSFEKTLKQQVGASTKGVTVGKVKVAKLSPSDANTDGAFGFSLTIPVQGPGITINVMTEIRGFLKKHTEVTLLSLTYGSGESLDSNALYGKLVDRAKASAV